MPFQALKNPPLADQPPGPPGAFYSAGDGQFLLPYELVRSAADPDRELLEFLQATYTAAATTGRGDRTQLETDPARWG